MKIAKRMAAVSVGLAMSLPWATAVLAQSSNPTESQMIHALTPIPPALSHGEQGLPVPGTAPPRPTTNALTRVSTGTPQAPGSGPPADKDAANSAAGFPAGCPGQTVQETRPTLSLPGLTFKFGSAELQPEAMPLLRTLVKTLQDLPNATFSIEGHTDATGSFAYNQELSVRRAEAIKAHLEQAGVKPERLKTTGVGYCGLANPADPSGGENRRVVVINTAS
ncbi:MAG TPA: OmpA family protein [Stellaceae bacterium]|nr:OmpA family protein [Stellaceae bacterium]